MSNDKIREIDMSDPVNFNKAVELALAASDPEGWAEQKAGPLHALVTSETDVWTVYNDGDNADGHAVIAITGNGEKSRANAEFIASARRVVLGLISEVDRLQTIARVSTRPTTEGSGNP